MKYLPCRMRVEVTVNLIHGSLDGSTFGPGFQQIGNPRKMFWSEHFGLRENQTKHRIVGNIVPVDQIIDNILVDSEGQHLGDNANRETRIRGEVTQLRDILEVAMCIDSKRDRPDRSRINARIFSRELQGFSLSRRIAKVCVPI